MIAIPGYQTLELLHESANSLIYRGRRESDGLSAILKMLKEEYPTPEQLTRYRTEYEITSSLNLNGVVKAYDLLKFHNTLVMVLEDFGGKSLTYWMSQARFTLLECLYLTRQIAEIVGQIHSQNIIHKDINPSNLVWKPSASEIKVIDFGISTASAGTISVAESSTLFEGTFAYLSPEQTGRIARAVDYRTDLYALGATFYEMLTQQKIFETTDPIEWVHCQIAKQPIPPHEVNPDIPRVVSDMAMKLLAKSADERYQSAWGLKADLEICLAQLQERGEIFEFELERESIADRVPVLLEFSDRDRDRSIASPENSEPDVRDASQSLNRVRALSNYWLVNSFALYLEGDTFAALSGIREAERLLASIPRELEGIEAFEYNFYYSLILCACYPHAAIAERETYWQKLQVCCERMRHFAQSDEVVGGDKYLLIEAEMARLEDRTLMAMDLYDRAIAACQNALEPHTEALANELAAQFWLSKGKEEFAEIYLKKAYNIYQVCRADRQFLKLSAKYPNLFTQTPPLKKSVAKSTTIQTFTTSRGSGEWLDLATAIAASQAIGSSLALEDLLQKLIKILMENAGATVGFLLLKQKGGLVVEAAGSVNAEETRVLESIPLESTEELCQAIVKYVAITRETVVLNDASVEEKFIYDPYIQTKKPKAILCVPLIHQSKLISIVYLENNLTAGAFTRERVEAIKLLSTQAAISLDNAKLYAEVRASESRFTQFLEAIPLGVFVLDALGQPYYSNQVGLELLGKGVLPDTHRDRLSEVYQIYLAGTEELYPSDRLPGVQALRGETTRSDDLEVHHPDKRIPLEAWGTPIYDDKGKVAYALIAFQNITERKKAEAERLEFIEEMFKLNCDLELSLEAELNLTDAASRFVPNEFLSFLGYESLADVKLGDAVQQEMSVLFSDIRDFTTLSETMTPEDNFKFINSYLSRMEPAIVENDGFIDKFIGDAIMALFGSNADDAVKAGIAMLHRLNEYNQHRANCQYPPIHIGVGINTGSLILGTVGGATRMDGTVISDAVNLASRLEGLTKNYGVSLLISHHTFSRLKNSADYAIRLIDRVQVKGKSELVTVYEVFDADPPELKTAKFATLEAFSQALSFYELGEFAIAAQRFEACLRHNSGDRVSLIYLQRCQEQM